MIENELTLNSFISKLRKVGRGKGDNPVKFYLWQELNLNTIQTNPETGEIIVAFVKPYDHTQNHIQIGMEVSRDEG